MADDAPENAEADAGKEDGKDKKDAKKDSEHKHVKTVSMIVYGVCFALALFEGMAILDTFMNARYIQIKVLVTTASAAGLIIGLLVMLNQCRLSRMATMAHLMDEIKADVKRFQKENNKLQKTCEDLHEDVERVKNAENQLEGIASQGEHNVELLVGIVKENKKVVRRQAKLARAQIQEQLLTMVLRTDKDQTLNLEGKEIDRLIMRMNTQDGIDLDEAKFREKISQKDGSIAAIMEVLRELGNDDEDLDEAAGDDVASLNTRDSVVSVNNKKLIKSMSNQNQQSLPSVPETIPEGESLETPDLK